MTWPAVALKEVLVPVSRATTLEPTMLYILLGAQWYAKGLFVREEKYGSDIQAKTLFEVRAGDFVYNRRFAWKGSFAIASPSDDGGFVSGEFPCFTVDRSKVEPGWLRWYFSLEKVWTEALGLSSGGTPTSRNRLKEERFLAMTIPLPPLPKQSRIVGRLERFTAKLREARQLQDDSIREVEGLQRATLAATAKLLSMQVGTRPLHQLIRDAGYGTSVKCSPEREPGAIPVLRIPNIAAERLDLADMKYGSLTNDELQRFAVADGDLLVVRTNGSLDLVGRCAVAPALAEPTAYASYLIKLRVDRSLVEPHFLQLMLKQLRSQGELIGLARTTAGQYNVSLGRLESARIPLPDLPRQREVVLYHSSLRSKTEELRELRKKIGTEIEATTSAYLSRALRGHI